MSIEKGPGYVTMHNPISYRNLMLGGGNFDSRLLKPLEIKDRQQALSRFKWTLNAGASGLVINFTGLMLERYLYQRGMFGTAVVEPGVLDVFNFAWNGSLDRQGRMRQIRPVFPTSLKDGKYQEEPWEFNYEVVYTTYEGDIRQGPNYGAVCFDYTPMGALTQIAPRSVLQREFVIEMANLYNFSTINLVNSLALAKYNLKDEAQRDAFEQELKNLYRDLRMGKYYQLTSTTQDLQDLTKPANYQGQEYWQSYNSLNNERLGALGLENTGAFNKKERKLGAETNIESKNSSLVIDNSLAERQNWCDVVNNIFGVNFSVEPAETDNEQGLEEASYERNDNISDSE